MKHKLKQLLIEAATKGEIISYRTAANHLSLRFSEKHGGYGVSFFDTMIEIGEEELLAGRPPINVLIINHTDHLPGPGFFKWYKKRSGVKFKIRNSIETERLAKQLQELCFEYWQQAN